MVRPALSAALSALGALAGCAAAPPPAARHVEPGRDLTPTGASVQVGDGREAVIAAAAEFRDALLARDAGRLRALLAPSLRGMQQPDVAMSREAWLGLGDALFSAAGAARERLAAAPSLAPSGVCPGQCPVMLGPGEWLVAWADVGARPRAPGLYGARGVTQLLPSALRVAVVGGVATVVGMDDAVVLSHGPQRVSGLRRP